MAIRCTISDEKVLIVSCYFSPSEDIVLVVTQFTGLVDKYPNDNILVVGEFNVKFSIGRKRPMDPRGEEDISFTVYHDLDIINNSYCTANFDSHQGESWIDLLLIRKCAHRITDWTIHDWVTLSNFNVMCSIYQGRSRNLHPRDVRRRCRPRVLVWDDFLCDLWTTDLDIYDHDSPDLGVENLESTLLRLCSDNRKRRLAVGRDTCW